MTNRHPPPRDKDHQYWRKDKVTGIVFPICEALTRDGKRCRYIAAFKHPSGRTICMMHMMRRGKSLSFCEPTSGGAPS